MATMDKLHLIDRTRSRNASLWVSFDWGGLLSPLENQQAAYNLLSQNAIENFMAVSDETFRIKEYQRDKTYELDQFAVRQDKQIAEEKVVAGLTKIAIQIATDEYVLAAMVYEAKVKSLLMSAREYAARVELEQLEVARQEAVLAVAKEGLHLKQVNAQIYYEAINQAMVEADLAKAQVDVAKAHVRAIMADIEAQEAEIKVINAQVEIAMADADKATLQANVASIFAQIMVKQLSQVKLAVGKAEIQAGFNYISMHLSDAINLYSEKRLIEGIKTELEKGLLTEEQLMLIAEKYAEDLREVQQLDSQQIYEHLKIATGLNIQQETDLKQLAVLARERLQDAHYQTAIQRDDKSTWEKKLIDAAHKWVYKNHVNWRTSIDRRYEYIEG